MERRIAVKNCRRIGKNAASLDAEWTLRFLLFCGIDPGAVLSVARIEERPEETPALRNRSQTSHATNLLRKRQTVWISIWGRRTKFRTRSSFWQSHESRSRDESPIGTQGNCTAQPHSLVNKTKRLLLPSVHVWLNFSPETRKARGAHRISYISICQFRHSLSGRFAGREESLFLQERHDRGVPSQSFPTIQALRYSGISHPS